MDINGFYRHSGSVRAEFRKAVDITTEFNQELTPLYIEYHSILENPRVNPVVTPSKSRNPRIREYNNETSWALAKLQV